MRNNEGTLYIIEKTDSDMVQMVRLVSPVDVSSTRVTVSALSFLKNTDSSCVPTLMIKLELLQFGLQ